MRTKTHIKHKSMKFSDAFSSQPVYKLCMHHLEVRLIYRHA